MFDEVDGFYYDMDALSSPITQRDESFPEISFTDVSQPLFELQGYPGIVSQQPKEQQQQMTLTVPELDLIKPSQKCCDTSEALKPKAKKQMVFMPFASFEATELTVKSLMDKSPKSAIIRL